jgi:hypothetical protein
MSVYQVSVFTAGCSICKKTGKEGGDSVEFAMSQLQSTPPSLLGYHQKAPHCQHGLEILKGRYLNIVSDLRLTRSMFRDAIARNVIPSRLSVRAVVNTGLA